MGQGEGQGAGSGQGCSGYTCIKYMFFIFNVLFWLMGCALLGVGIWLHVVQDDYAAMTEGQNYFSVTIVCIVAGCIMIVVSFFGCCGAVMESKWMLIFYFILVIIIFIAEITFGIIAFVYRDEIGGELRKELNRGLQEDYGKDNSLTDAWDHIQQQLKCCGVHNATDWYGISEWPGETRTPDSCCVFKTKDCGMESDEASEKFTKGCYEEVKYEISRYLYILGVIGLTIGVLQILGLVASMALFCFLRSDKYADDDFRHY